MAGEVTDKYFLAIVPPEPYYSQALKFKEEANNRFETKGALRSPPHITVHMPFTLNEKKALQLGAQLTSFFLNEQPYPIQMKNWGSFPPRVVFLDVVKSEHLAETHRSIQDFMKLRFQVFNSDFKDQAFHPHLTIAFRDLKKARFSECFDYFSKQEVHWDWVMESVFLLKLVNSKWELHHEFKFGSL